MGRPSNYKTGQIRHNNETLILGAAEQVFATYGFKGASMGSIADLAGVPRPNVNYYFKSKKALYRAVLLSVVNSWIVLFDYMNPEDEPATALRDYIHAKVQHAKDNPFASKVYANELLHGAPVLHDFLFGEHKDWFEAKISVIHAWIQQKKMDAVDPVTLILLIWSSTQQYADYSVQIHSLYGEPLNNKHYEAISSNLCQIILKGCGLESE